MALTITLKARGKRRIIESPPSDTPPFVPSASEPPHPTKRVRRAETRKCPVCDEDIPLRLLPMHALLEADRVEEIVKAVGSSDVLFEDFADEPGPSSRIRRSAIKARKNITSTRNTQDSLEQSNKTIQAVKRRRKQRSTKLKEMLKEDEERENSKDSWMRRFTGEEITCPVCLAVVRGDQDVLDAHVDSCLAHENRLLEEARQREAMHQYATEEDTWEVHDDRGGYVGDVRGAGFYRRDNDECVDEEIDIDGDDEAVFGEAQFTEGDVVPINPNVEIDEDIEVEIEDDDSPRREGSTLGNLVPVGNPGAGRVHGQKDDSGDTHIAITGMSETDKSELNILIARQQGDKAALVTALESKIKLLESNAASTSSSVLCRICIDPYKEPTISTGCWHTCCKECWLRCLGSTKLCPICKRITGATDLRRIYL